MSGAGGTVLRENACQVGRDVRGVHTEVHALLQAGVLDRVADGFLFSFDAVRIDFTLQLAAYECEVT
jgi:predicted transcriptional regulator